MPPKSTKKTYVNPNNKKPKKPKITTQKQLKSTNPTTNQAIRNENLMEKMCNLIKNGDIDLKTKPRILTPFTKGQGVMLTEGKGYILEPNLGLEQTQHDLYVRAGAMSAYKSIANSMSGHYNKFHLLKIKEYLTLTAENITNLNAFNTFIKKKWSNPLEKLTGTNRQKDRARKALNYLSAILMFAEPYRLQDKGKESLDLIDRMITEYTPSNTPSKPILGNKNGKGAPVVKKGFLKEQRKAARQLEFEKSSHKNGNK